MNMKDYQDSAQRTVSQAFHSGNVPAPALYAIIYRALKESRHMDVAKKSLFYGREAAVTTAEIIDGAAPIPASYDPQQIHILHGILGVYTEAVELVEHLARSLVSGEPIDVKELINESGDVLWYLALMFKNLGVSFEQVAAGNIKKLATRYPDKFVDIGARGEQLEMTEMMKTIKNAE